ncbi:hypothetical protein BASA83_013649 [Batrachochytrium salamandrivorans]|nr:hypothetical protein BASA83_013649 [Batrachochytrium salamandrivorans]
MDQAIRSTTGFLNDDKSNSTTLDHSDAIHLQLNLFLASTLNSTNIDMLITLKSSANTATFCPNHCNSHSTTSTSDDMDIDFARRGSLSFSDRQQGLVKDFVLFAVSQAISKPFVPGPIPVSDPNAISKPSKWNTRNIRSQETISSTPSRGLDSAVKLLPPVTLKRT